jgi:putative NADH-flavin reductase
MKLVIFGANGPTGRLVTAMAIAEGHAVTAVTRRPDSFPLHGSRLQVAGADVLDANAVDRVMAGQEAVISALGVPYTTQPVVVYSQGTRNIVQAMMNHGLRRLVCVSSLGVSPEIAPGETLIFRTLIGPFLLRLGRTVYEDMRHMEEIVRTSGLEWTIIRPAGLFDSTGVTDYHVATRRMPGRFTSRTDLADALVREAVDNRHVGSAIEIVTTNGTPSFAKMFLKEALHIGT